MIQVAQRPLTFDEFLAWYPDDGGIYELIDGRVVPVNPTDPHEKISGFLVKKLNTAIDQANLPYFIPRTCTIKPFTNLDGYKPDVVVLDESVLAAEPRWEKESTIVHGKTIKLAIEVASTNWRDDYERKLPDYEEMGIVEYWIVDYRGLAAVRHLGSPKRPTMSVYELVEGEYLLRQFHGDDRIQSAVIPNLQLTVTQVVSSGQIGPNATSGA